MKDVTRCYSSLSKFEFDMTSHVIMLLKESNSSSRRRRRGGNDGSGKKHTRVRLEGVI